RFHTIHWRMFVELANRGHKPPGTSRHEPMAVSGIARITTIQLLPKCQLLTADLPSILLRAEQAFNLARISELHFEKPAAGIGFTVDESRVVREGFVSFGHLAGHR